MYIRVTYPKFQAFDNNGHFAVGYEVHTFAAGTSTPAASYSDRLCTVPNTNPVVLSARGEADIYAQVPLDLVFTIPGGDPSSPIWNVDYYGEQQNTLIVSGNATSGTSTPPYTDNNYVFNPTPAFLSLPDELILVLNIDKSNIDTIRDPVTGDINYTFSGTGFNDLIFGGPYVGTTAGSVFTVQIDNSASQAPVRPTAVLSGTAGTVTTGNHQVRLTAVTAVGETNPGSASAVVAADGTHKIDVSGIPAVAAPITGYNVYMNEAGGTDYFLVNAAPIVATTYAIDIDDVTLATHTAMPSTNTTGDGSGNDTFKWKKDGGAWTTDVSITGVAQILIEGVTVYFAERSGHTLNDVWALTVMTPARLNVSGLGNYIIEKNSGQAMKALDGGDMINSYPAQFIFSLSQTKFALINPSLPVLSASAQIPNRVRVEVTSDVILTIADKGKEIACVGDLTVTLPACASAPHTFYYVCNKGEGVVTVAAAGGTDKIYLPGDMVGGTTIVLEGGGFWCVQLDTNGVDWLVSTITETHRGTVLLTTANDGQAWACPKNVRTIFVTGCAAGGGGAAIGGAAGGAGGGGAGQCVFKQQYTVVPDSGYTLQIPAGGAGGMASSDGTDGGDAAILGLLTLTGGGGGKQSAAAGGTSGGFGAQPGTKGYMDIDGTTIVGGNGGSSMFGVGGIGKSGTAGDPGHGYGAGGGGAMNAGAAAGGNGAPAFFLIEW